MEFKFWRKKKGDAEVSPEQGLEVAETPVAETPVAAPAPDFEPVSLPKRSASKGIRSLFSRIKFDLEDLATLEDVLIQADFGVDTSEQLIADLRKRAKSEGVSSDQQLRALLVTLLTEAMTSDRSALNLNSGAQPYVILVVGVNGVGKTTTIGKLSQWLHEGGWKVTLGAADTFRAAAVEQLATWAERAGVDIVRPDAPGQDPAAVAFKAVESARANGHDIVIVDTAGRLQNKTDLMNELGKVRRVIEKTVPISETLLVLDATTGQNGLEQAKVFTEVAGVTGIALTKLDGSAKGGIAFAIQSKLGIPIKLVGVGEGVSDFAFFDPAEYARGLVD